MARRIEHLICALAIVYAAGFGLGCGNRGTSGVADAENGEADLIGRTALHDTQTDLGASYHPDGNFVFPDLVASEDSSLAEIATPDLTSANQSGDQSIPVDTADTDADLATPPSDDLAEPPGDLDTPDQVAPFDSSSSDAADTKATDDIAADTGGYELKYTPEGCLILNVSHIVLDTRPVSGPSSYNGEITPPLGGPAPDLIRIEFYKNSEVTPKAGTVDLSLGPYNTNYADCTHCFRVMQDWDDPENLTYYFQVSGTLKLTKIIMPPDGDESAGSVTDLKLIEVTLQAPSGYSTPVPGGKCLFVPYATWSTN